MPAEDTKEAEPHWITCVYDAEVVKVDGKWLFKRITSNMKMISPAKDGWVKTRFPAGSDTNPYLLFLEEGTYYWCACGKSKNQALLRRFTQGHRHQPAEVRDERVRLCRNVRAAQKTGTPPFCDATHLGLDI